MCWEEESETSSAARFLLSGVTCSPGESSSMLFALVEEEGVGERRLRACRADCACEWGELSDGGVAILLAVGERLFFLFADILKSVRR